MCVLRVTAVQCLVQCRRPGFLTAEVVLRACSQTLDAKEAWDVHCAPERVGELVESR